MTKLKKLVQQKLLENEFENKPKVRDGVQAPYQHLLDEMEYLEKKMQSCHFQADQLDARLRNLQKNHYDDMTIIDEDHRSLTTPPWKSSIAHTRNKYVYWDVERKHMIRRRGDAVEEVVIRKDGNSKQIKILDTICRRLQALDELFVKFHKRKNDVKRELREKHKIAFDQSI